MEYISYGIMTLFVSVLVIETFKLFIGSYKDKQNGKN